MLPEVNAGKLKLRLPIIQGGMGIGISMSRLASAVMKEGGMGVISAAMPGVCEPDFEKDPIAANLRVLNREIRKAKKTEGMLGVNVMVASQHYDLYVNAAIEAGADAIISGAGLPLSLPEYVKGRCMMAPIISSGKACRLVLKMWDRHHSCTPDFIVIEGWRAGGHLGFKKEDLVAGTCQSNEEILADVLKEVQPYREKYGKPIPVFVGGGIFDHEDIVHIMECGADGVQMATRFIATKECDADENFKKMIIRATEKDIVLVKSPAGFPGRAVHSAFIQRTENMPLQSIDKCYGCMIPCKPASTPYCITRALAAAVKGDTENGLFFCGTNAARVTEMTDVHTLMQELAEGGKQSQ